jgi:diguanylate cyclase (GGDEF)-like protein
MRSLLKRDYPNYVKAIILVVVYIFLFYILHPFMGDGVSALSLFPVALIGWLYGIQGGMLGSVILAVIDIFLFWLEGDVPIHLILLQGGTAGFFSLVFIGIASGWIRIIYEKNKKIVVERALLEAAINKSEQEYRSLFENMAEGIAIDEIIYKNGEAVDWIIQDVNPSYEKILGITRKSVTGQMASKVYGITEVFTNLLAEYDQAVHLGKTPPRKIHTSIGERDLVSTTISLGDNRIAAIFSDVTDHELAIRAEREQRIISTAMQEILSALNSTIQLDEVLNIILDNMERYVSFDVTDIMLLENGQLRIVRHRGYKERGLDNFVEGFSIPIGDFGTNRWMTDHLQPLIIPDTTKSILWQVIPGTAWIASYMGFPIIAKGKIIGILNFASSKTNFFLDYRVENFNFFTDQVALAIENARIYEETQRRAHRLSLINRVASRLTAPAELDEVEQLAVDCLAEALEIEQIGLALLNSDRQYLILVSYHPGPGNIPLKGSIIPLENNPSMDFVIEHKTSFWSDDAQNDPRLTAVRDLMVNQKIIGILIVPLIVRGEVIGTFGCDVLVKGKTFSREEIDLAETLANFVAGRIEQAQLLEREKKRSKEFSMLHDTTLAISQSYELPVLLEQIVERATWLLDSSAGMLYLVNSEAGILECKVSFNSFQDQVGTTLRIGEGAAGIVAQTAYPLIIPNYAAWNHKPEIYSGIDTPFAVLSVPVIWQSQVKGVIQLIRDKDGSDPYESKDASLLSLFSSQVAISLENTKLYQEVQRMAVQDPLTGLHNRRGFSDLANRELARAIRYKRPLCIMFIDIDHFKSVNDRYGHSTGDLVIKNVAEVCCQHLRNLDVIGRYGGEEFTVLISESSVDATQEIAERLRQLVEKTPTATTQGEIYVTVSIGIAEYEPNNASLDELISCADQALYKAKSSGRNRIVIYSKNI